MILFIPGDQFLSAAMNEIPNLHEEAMRQKVIIATPTSLVALLKTIAHGWRQLALAENAEEIRRLGEDLYARLTVFTGHVAKMGSQLESSIRTYNSAVGSLKQKVLPGARKFVELGVRSDKKTDSIVEIETVVRRSDHLSSRSLTDNSQDDAPSEDDDETHAEH